MLHELRMQLFVFSSGYAGKKGDDMMHDIDDYIMLITAIVGQLVKANLQQLRRLYIFINEYLKD
ncbi:MAG: hypothetical protein ACI4EE_12950 [Lachnospiraceae bacterium]